MLVVEISSGFIQSALEPDDFLKMLETMTKRAEKRNSDHTNYGYVGHYNSAHCTTTYQEKCSTKYLDKCDEGCEECVPEYKDTCKTIYEDVCDTKYEDVCNIVYEEKCSSQYESIPGVGPYFRVKNFVSGR